MKLLRSLLEELEDLLLALQSTRNVTGNKRMPNRRKKKKQLVLKIQMFIEKVLSRLIADPSLVMHTAINLPFLNLLSSNAENTPEGPPWDIKSVLQTGKDKTKKTLSMTTSITIPSACDFHLHLRQDEMMRMVTPKVQEGGVSLAYIMPNLQPPIKTTAEALAYKAELEALAPNVTFYMTLYLSPELTPEEVRKAAKAGIAGVKSYPRGVTTNSESGIENYEVYYPVFKAMEEEGLVLNLHGEIPSDAEKDICVMNAEERFLPQLEKIHRAFPKLKIVLEHATTKAAVDMVKSLGDTVGCSITVHHLQLIVDDWAGQAHHFCKPVAKYPHDRDALRDIVKSGHPRFFLGTDSAPHPIAAKEGPKSNAGVFTTPLVLPYLAKIFEEIGCLDKLENFACHYGRQFYGLSHKQGFEDKKVTLVKESNTVVPAKFEISSTEDLGVVVPFYANKDIGWKITSNFY
ncbi:hypothetical protein BDF20DRAFT_839013 [Mycotypha africana]|uniref:uncharacterized protein n=1 Tax=Mycotypha africana TaxID=64632 RepID=UPI0022FFD9F7|nr:uncharacterized protein BDF20DRAFT_839013 [Mycotypha africana]KAI8969047.1 hypothetical protein BDF20DRAFT_839013 [Mycotypha africana]